MHPFSLRPRKTGLSNRPCDIFFIVKLSLSLTSTLATRAQSNNMRLSLPGLVQSLQLTGVSSLLNVLAVKAYGEAEFWLSGTCRQMVSRTGSPNIAFIVLRKPSIESAYYLCGWFHVRRGATHRGDATMREILLQCDGCECQNFTTLGHRIVPSLCVY
jgi:hypothetical protein